MAFLECSKANFTILFTAKRSSKTRLLLYVITAQLKSIQNRYICIRSHVTKFPVPQDFHLTALQPAIRPTSHRCIGPVSSHNAGDGCLITIMVL